MARPQLRVPVALLIFNRPDTTEQVATEIVKAEPSRLFVIADGPRAGHPEDQERCRQARAVIERIDWKCEVVKNYSDTNLGCGYRPASGIDWVFENVEQAIILEDDCIPHPTFFRFCEELLDRYKDDERVMMISGRNDTAETYKMTHSYAFRRVMSCWGWATWRRAWRHQDMEIKGWPSVRDSNWLKEVLGGHEKGASFWKEIFDEALELMPNVDFWDYQWAFACWLQNGYAIVPERNLVRNVGHRPDATHTMNPASHWGKRAEEAMAFPLRHPTYFIPDKQGDDVFLDLITAPLRRSLVQRLVGKIKRIMTDHKFFRLDASQAN